MTADRFVFSPVNPTAQHSPLAAFSVMGDAPSFDITRELVVQRDVRFEAVGEAHFDLDAPGGLMSVDNLGSSGCDGVSIHVDDEIIDKCELPAALAPHTSLHVSGTVDGQSTQLGTLEVEQAGADYAIVPDYSVSGVSSYTVQVLLGGAVLETRTGLTGQIAFTSSPPKDWTISTFWFFYPGPGCDETQWPFPIQVSLPGGGTHSADRLRIFPEHGPVAQRIEAVTLTSDTSSFLTLTDAVVGEGGDDALGAVYCAPAEVNSTGSPARIQAVGSSVAADNDVTLHAADLPPNQFGYFLVSQTQGFIAHPGGSQGNLCLGGALGRYTNNVFHSGAAGTASLQLDLTSVPTPGPPATVMAGETWNFTAWYRDFNPVPTSNFTSAVSIDFD